MSKSYDMTNVVYLVSNPLFDLVVYHVNQILYLKYGKMVTLDDAKKHCHKFSNTLTSQVLVTSVYSILFNHISVEKANEYVDDIALNIATSLKEQRKPTYKILDTIIQCRNIFKSKVFDQSDTQFLLGDIANWEQIIINWFSANSRLLDDLSIKHDDDTVIIQNIRTKRSLNSDGDTIPGSLNAVSKRLLPYNGYLFCEVINAHINAIESTINTKTLHSIDVTGLLKEYFSNDEVVDIDLYS